MDKCNGAIAIIAILHAAEADDAIFACRSVLARNLGDEAASFREKIGAGKNIVQTLNEGLGGHVAHACDEEEEQGDDLQRQGLRSEAPQHRALRRRLHVRHGAETPNEQ
jgi:hypothetical protein